MAIRIQLRRDTAANWTSANPVLLAGEIGIETDTLQFKIGNGNNWNSITEYANTTPADLSTSLEDYILLSDRGAANGVASLNSSTKIPNTQIDSTYYATVSSVTSAINTLDADHEAQISDIEDTIGGIVTDIADIQEAANTLTTTVSGHTTDISDLELSKAPLSSPTFTGNVVLPSSTAIGSISSTELSYVNGVTSGIQSQLDSKASSSSLTTHTEDTTEVHGITDTSLLVTTTGTQALSNKTLVSPEISIGGYTVGSTLASSLSATLGGVYGTNQMDIYDVDWTSFINTNDKIFLYSAGNTQLNSTVWTVTEVSGAPINFVMLTADTPVSEGSFVDVVVTEVKEASGSSVTISATEVSYLNGVTSDIQTQLNAKATTSSLSAHSSDTTNIHGITDTSKLVITDGTAQTIAGDITITGDLIVSGTTTTQNTSSIEVEDPLIYIGTGNTGNSLDMGFVGHFDNGTYQHTGFVRDASTNKWRLFSGIADEPGTTVDFTTAVYDVLRAGGIEFSDGTQTKEGVPSRTPIISKTESYTLSSLSERDSMIEVSSSSATTITIPANADVAFPIGASIDISQISTGQVTIAGAVGVTVNSTPGLKLRTQWSTATLFKRAENTWLVYGDLTA